jgi:hypothetical protein
MIYTVYTLHSQANCKVVNTCKTSDVMVHVSATLVAESQLRQNTVSHIGQLKELGYRKASFHFLE